MAPREEEATSTSRCGGLTGWFFWSVMLYTAASLLVGCARVVDSDRGHFLDAIAAYSRFEGKITEPKIFTKEELKLYDGSAAGRHGTNDTGSISFPLHLMPDQSTACTEYATSAIQQPKQTSLALF